MSEFIYYSKGAPMADASGNISLARERVVRCRDCEYYANDELGDCCTLMDFEDVKGMADRFCAWGEKAVKDESDED